MPSAVNHQVLCEQTKKQTHDSTFHFIWLLFSTFAENYSDTLSESVIDTSINTDKKGNNSGEVYVVFLVED